MMNNFDYAISKEDAKKLRGIALLPGELREAALRNEFGGRSTLGIIKLFSEFIGLANSVIVNNRETIEMYLILEVKEPERIAEKVNLPTVFGALAGIEIAVEPTKRMCSGCAFRQGTPANQSPVTALDAEYAVDCQSGFLCHEEADGSGRPKKNCAGFSKARCT